MKTTHNQAIEILQKTGDAGAAWIIAQQDEGLLPHVTFAMWHSFALDCIAKRKAAA